MKTKNKYFNFSGTKNIPIKNKIDIISIFSSETKPKRNDDKKAYSIMRKYLLSITKEDIKNTKQLFIKSYKEDIEKLNTDHTLNINDENDDDDILEPNYGEKLDLEHTKNKYADKNYSSSNMSD